LTTMQEYERDNAVGPSLRQVSMWMKFSLIIIIISIL